MNREAGVSGHQVTASTVLSQINGTIVTTSTVMAEVTPRISTSGKYCGSSYNYCLSVVLRMRGLRLKINLLNLLLSSYWQTKLQTLSVLLLLIGLVRRNNLK